MARSPRCSPAPPPTGCCSPSPRTSTLLLGGVGVIWCEITVHRTGSHAGEPGAEGSALEGALEIAERLRALTPAFEDGDADLRDPAERYLFNIGTLQAGEWISNAPSVATLGVRVGYPPASPAEAQAHVRAAVASADPRAPSPSPGSGRRATGSLTDDPFAAAIAAHTASVHGEETTSSSGSATNDARFYARRGIPAVCYGPHGRNLHAVDEAVEIASIAEGRARSRGYSAVVARGRRVTDISLGGAARAARRSRPCACGTRASTWPTVS